MMPALLRHGLIAGLAVFSAGCVVPPVASGGDLLGQWQVDFDKQTIVLVQMGEQPTLGYSIKLEPPVLRSADGISLTVRQQSPAPGMLTGMALTSPCTYALLNAADVSTVQVRDAESQQVLHTWQR